MIDHVNTVLRRLQCTDPRCPEVAIDTTDASFTNRSRREFLLQIVPFERRA